MPVYLDYSQGHLEGSVARARCVGVRGAEQDQAREGTEVGCWGSLQAMQGPLALMR